MSDVKLPKSLRTRQKMSIFRIVAPQDGGWSLTPMENLLRGLRNGHDVISLEIFGMSGVVGYVVRAYNGDGMGGVLHSYFPQAQVERRSDRVEGELDNSDWLHLDAEDLAMVQPLSLTRESYLPLRIFDDRIIEQSQRDPLAGVIGQLASSTRSGGELAGDRLGVRLILRPAEESWNSLWQDRMQRRRDGEDKNSRPGGGGAASQQVNAPGMGAMAAWGGIGALALGNWWLWDQGNTMGMLLFDLAAAVAAIGGGSLWRKYGNNKRRPYLDEELVEAKLKALAFWTEVQIVRVCRFGEEDAALASMEGLLDCLRAFDDPAGNSWREGKVHYYLGSDVEQSNHEGHGKHPFLGGSGVMGWVEPQRARRTALSAREVASLWHPPLGVDEMASMERTAAGILTPYLVDLSVEAEDAGPLVGVAGLENQNIRLPESSLRKHTIVLGRSGVGKSTMIKHVLAHKLERKAQGKDDGAIVVIDPHADLVRDTLKLVPTSIADKVRLLDFGRADRVPGINLVDPHLFPDRDRCVDTIIGTVKHLWEHWGGRLEDLLKRSLSIVYEFNAHPATSRGEMLTILDILALLDEGKTVGTGRGARTVASDFQRYVLSRVTDFRLKEWFNAYLNWPADTRSEAVGPVHSRIGAYAADARASVIMGQRESTIMLSDVLTEGLVLLVSTAQGSIGAAPAALMGGTMVSLVESALRDQERLPPSERVRCLLVCDEFQTVTGANWEGLLAESRKYGCSLMLATQSMARLDTPDRRLKAGVLGNVGCIVGYQMSAEDARIISAEMDAERVQERFLVNLHPRHCYVRINTDTKCYPAFSMRTLPPVDEYKGTEEAEAAVLAASVAYTIDTAQARARMNEELRQRSDMFKTGGGGAEAGEAEAVAAGGEAEAVAAEGGGEDHFSSIMSSVNAAKDARVEEGELKGLRQADVEGSRFSSVVLADISKSVNTDPGLRGAVDSRIGSHISRERKKVRLEEEAAIREEVRTLAEADFQEREKKLREEAYAEARKELGVAQSGEPGSPRDPDALQRVDS